MKIALIILILAAPCLVAAQDSHQAPVMRLNDIHGRILKLEAYKGKVVLLNFWATWCAPCRSEIQELVKWQRRYSSQGLQVIGIAYPPEKLSQVRSFALKKRINYPIALGTKETKLKFSSTETLPFSVIIDAEGNVREMIEGMIFPEEFAAKIQPILSRQPPTAVSHENGTRQRVTIIVDGDGYHPTTVKLRKGLPARLTFIRRVAESCGTEIVIPEYHINRPLPLNQPVVVSFTPRRAGRIKMTCGMDMFRGSLIVK